MTETEEFLKTNIPYYTEHTLKSKGNNLSTCHVSLTVSVIAPKASIYLITRANLSNTYSAPDKKG
ncbi:MAG: hypothetical protein AB2693_33150 [Candidatus Thiodiazotropha sp.]